MTKSVFGMANSESQVTNIIDQLLSAGFTKDDISVLFPDRKATKDFAYEKHTKAPEGATTGVISGGVLGGILGLLAGVGALAIPGLGPFTAAGPIMALLSGAAVLGFVGGLVGLLVGLGVPEYEAKRYEDKIRKGHILMAVSTMNSELEAKAKRIFESGGMVDVASSIDASERSTVKHA
jgi:hypothetical protein